MVFREYYKAVIPQVQGPVSEIEVPRLSGDAFTVLDVKGLMQQVGEDVASNRPCKYRKWRYIDVSTGETRPFNCRSWNCLACRQGMANKWARRFVDAQPERWFTITNVPDDKTVCRLKWQQYIRAVRHGYGLRRDRAQVFLDVAYKIAKAMGVHLSASQQSRLLSEVRQGHDIEYARVLERGQLHGMRHYHVLYKGNRISHLVIVTLAVLFGFGRVGHEGPIRDEGGSWYVAKYLGKSGGEKGWRKVTTSRRMLPRVVSVPNDWVLYSPDMYRSTVNGRRFHEMGLYQHRMVWDSVKKLVEKMKVKSVETVECGDWFVYDSHWTRVFGGVENAHW